MAIPEDQSHRVKRIVLPSGKTIEVVYFDHAAQELSAQDLEPAPPKPLLPAEELPGLHICPECDSDLVYPTKWEEVKKGQWNVSLRCPACEWMTTDVFDQDLLDSFDEELDRGTEVLMHDLQQLTRANMADEIDRFVSALDADAVWPEDF